MKRAVVTALGFSVVLWSAASSVGMPAYERTEDIASTCLHWFPEDLKQRLMCVSSEEKAYVALAMHSHQSSRESQLVTTCDSEWPQNYGEQLMCFETKWASWQEVIQLQRANAGDANIAGAIGHCIEPNDGPSPDYDAMRICAESVLAE
jgi:hypothetical protein